MSAPELSIIRRYVTSLSPTGTLGLITRQWASQGFVTETWDLQGALATTHPEWTGTVLRQGSRSNALVSDLVLDGIIGEAFPAVVLAVPWAARQHGRVRIAIISRPLPGPPGATELIGWHVPHTTGTFSDRIAKDYVTDLLDDLAGTLKNAGCLLSGPERPSKNLPAEHPFSPQQRRRLIKAARKQNRR